jgi:Kef-type K+ transport system membrane component KefB
VRAPSEPRPPGTLASAAAYGLLLAGTVCLFLLFRGWGEALTAPGPQAPSAAVAEEPGQTLNTSFHVLLALAVIIITCRLVGRLFGYLGQPPVIGEVVAGILLGPSLLGRVSPEASAFLLPPAVAPYLGVIAQLGVILYMFLIGLELNLGFLRQRVREMVMIAHAGIAVPFLLGTALALGLYTRVCSDAVSFTSFALFLGISMSVTAFPVLARILSDRGLQRTPLGVLALGCAALGDVTAWCLLAFVVGVAQSEMHGALLVVLCTLAYIALMVVAVRPVAKKLLVPLKESQLSRGVVAWIFVALLVSALITQAIGVHAIFGAFLLGAVIPHDSAAARVLTRRLEDGLTVLFLPAFFAFTGMRTEIGLVSGGEQWLLCGLIILVATVGKFGGTLAAARFLRLEWREGAALGILMNTRGLMELIVLNIGLDLGVIPPTLFVMMILMALATTMVTSPALAAILHSASPASDRASAWEGGSPVTSPEVPVSSG